MYIVPFFLWHTFKTIHQNLNRYLILDFSFLIDEAMKHQIWCGGLSVSRHYCSSGKFMFLCIQLNTNKLLELFLKKSHSFCQKLYFPFVSVFHVLCLWPDILLHWYNRSPGSWTHILLITNQLLSPLKILRNVFLLFFCLLETSDNVLFSVYKMFKESCVSEEPKHFWMS